MKDICKGVAAKIILFIMIFLVIVIVIVIESCLLYHRWTENRNIKTGHNKGNYVQTIQEKLELTAELNTGSYLCTDIVTKTDSRTINDWKIPLTEKSFIISYDGIVKAGIKDLTKAQVSKKGKLDIARDNAEAIMSGMLVSPGGEYDIKIEWLS